MKDIKIAGKDTPPAWKIAAITTIGVSAAFCISMLLNPGGDQPLENPNAQSGYIVGQGLAYGGVVAAIAYMVMLKNAGKAARTIAIIAIIAAGITGAMLTR